MNVSIIILTYNHSKYIEELLESLKYQILNYNMAHQHNVQVVISDDCSHDDTVQIISKWMRKNCKLFDDYILLTNEINLGTCKNYIRALSRTSGDYIKALGGDDIFPQISVFSIMSKLDKYDIVYGIPFAFNENSENNPDIILRQCEKINCENIEGEKNTYYKRIHRQCFLNAPATYVKKQLLIAPEVIDFLETYKYVDDYTQWIKMSELKDIKTCYINDFTIIYRRTNNSSYIIKSSELQKELIRIYRYAERTCNDWKSKILLKSRLNILVGKSREPFGDLLAYIRNFYWLKNRNRVSFGIDREKIAKTLDYVKRIKLSALEGRNERIYDEV